MRLSRLWTPSLTAGIAGALVIYHASIGINWTAWTVIAVAGLLIYRRPDAALRRALAVPLGFAVLLSGGFAVTTSGFLIFCDFILVASLLALSLLLGREPARADSYGAIDIITAPIRGFACTLRGALSNIIENARTTRIATISPALRGSLIAVPVVVLFALLFATADPVFASGRDAVYNVFGAWSMGPRVIFGVAVALFVAGAYTGSLAVISTRRQVAPAQADGPSRLVERRIIVGAAAAICWLFVLLQIGYLFFGNPGTVGSGVTFAQYARQGFGELALAATVAALVIVGTHSDEYFPPLPTRAHRSLTAPSLILLAAVVCILISAFHRVTLYEDAYGFSVDRVYAQAYILLTLAVLIILAWQVLHVFDVRALARNVMTISLIAFSFLLYWNCDAWVVRANLDRFATTSKVDVNYLASGLSLDAYPLLVRDLPRMTPSDRATATASLHTASSTERLRNPKQWYEWNLRRSQARDALRQLGKRVD